MGHTIEYCIGASYGIQHEAIARAYNVCVCCGAVQVRGVLDSEKNE